MTTELLAGYYQDIIQIGGIKIPLIHSDGNKYFPITYVTQKLLLREKSSNVTFIRNAKEGSVVKFDVEYGDITGGNNKQPSNCVEINELARILSDTQSVRLSVEQRELQNKLHKYLMIGLLNVDEYDKDQFNKNKIINYDTATKMVISQVLADNPNVSGRNCSKCGNHYPLTTSFFYQIENGLDTKCIKCKQGKRYNFRCNDEYVNYLLNTENDGFVEYHLNQDAVKMHEAHREGLVKRLPNWIYTKENFELIIKHMYENGIVSEENLAARKLMQLKLSIQKFHINMTEVYAVLFGEFFYHYNWKYPNFTFSGIELTPEISKINFDNYLKEFNITIDDPFNFNYHEILNNCNLTNIYSKLGGICGFFVYYWKGKYAGYQFREIGNYYRWNRGNVLSDLKFLVENDLKIQVEKIPLYVTKQSLRSIASPLWGYIVNKKNGSLYEWFNELYPNQFDETDFEIGRYRNNFDSIEEEQVDGVLRECLPNVIYNYNNSDQVVTLKGKRPDWIVLSENRVWIIEFLGMYIESQKNNEIISSYIDSTHEKMKLYAELKSYSTIYLYPSDLINGFEGVRQKISVIG